MMNMLLNMQMVDIVPLSPTTRDSDFGNCLYYCWCFQIIFMNLFIYSSISTYLFISIYLSVHPYLSIYQYHTPSILLDKSTLFSSPHLLALSLFVYFLLVADIFLLRPLIMLFCCQYHRQE